MADALTTITNLINSPPGQLVAGGVLAGIVWKFFDKVEAVLTDQTKFEIAVWLVGVKVGQKVQPWPDTFTELFEKVFGKRHFSAECIWRSAMASIVTSMLVIAFIALRPTHDEAITEHVEAMVVVFLPYVLIANVIPDYIALLSTRLMLRFMRSWARLSFLFLLVDLVVTLWLACVGMLLGGEACTYVWQHHWTPHANFKQPMEVDLTGIGLGYWNAPFYIFVFGVPMRYGNTIPEPLPMLVPAMVTCIWLWLYAGSGFLLKFARRFDTGFQWFNRKFDIEKKPLSAIGLVAGALVAVTYWAAVVVSRLV
jgi:hypothetical protein